MHKNIRRRRIALVLGIIAIDNLRELALGALTAANSQSRPKRLLSTLGAETKLFDPEGLPVDSEGSSSHAKVLELAELTNWSDGHVWCSPEHHGSMSGVMKLIIDYLPSSKQASAVRGKPLCLMQVAGGQLSGNALNEMQRVGRSLGMYSTSRQIAVADVSKQLFEGGVSRGSFATGWAMPWTSFSSSPYCCAIMRSGCMMCRARASRASGSSRRDNPSYLKSASWRFWRPEASKLAGSSHCSKARLMAGQSRSMIANQAVSRLRLL